jgi:hypothetical protein
MVEHFQQSKIIRNCHLPIFDRGKNLSKKN